MTRDDLIRAWRAAGITENDIDGYLEFFDIAYEAGAVAEREKLARKPEPVAWMVYTLDGASAFVTDNPDDIGSDNRALPLYANYFDDTALLLKCLAALESGRPDIRHIAIERLRARLEGEQ